ncbi:uncharacterized protein CANTADRAFT_143557 [Suhomyces tanzawaensis NRRL Y-17324]|uniref:Uncharacterized protein n=1 Tax=Suhomyces tanzawaensis NRRL Y-17324 TaxID=984487 RepID=A0A1E4SSD0_9ASCO|nr:uncharacterized protein CANTADRAFT_143557 [Suhomyces tanzawaensis NRRL Y-17324]ODV82414.1 hypothetical protein CANTADRAFT_143557 [Suhomyces tanzawaensis NRRL Y-17324]
MTLGLADGACATPVFQSEGCLCCPLRVSICTGGKLRFAMTHACIGFLDPVVIHLLLLDPISSPIVQETCQSSSPVSRYSLNCRHGKVWNSLTELSSFQDTTSGELIFQKWMKSLVGAARTPRWQPTLFMEITHYVECWNYESPIVQEPPINGCEIRH